MPSTPPTPSGPIAALVEWLTSGTAGRAGDLIAWIAAHHAEINDPRAGRFEANWGTGMAPAKPRIQHDDTPIEHVHW